MARTCIGTRCRSSRKNLVSETPVVHANPASEPQPDRASYAEADLARSA